MSDIFSKRFHNKVWRRVFFSFFILLIGCSSQDNYMPHKSDGNKRLVSDKAMVSSAHPLASEAGLKMLEKGGNAIDAAVATAFALNVVEPNMSGIGGGGTMLFWNQKNKKASYVDFYTAKRADSYKGINHDQYEDGEFNLLSTGIPGTVDGLLQALERHGTMSRKEVMAPAITYASEGFPVYMTLAQFIRDNEEKLKRYEGAKKTFWPDDKPLAVGEILKQPELAQTLQNISDNGASAFYQGENAEDIVEILNEAGNPITLKDLSDYEPQWNKMPLCGTYKGYTVLSAPLPQTGFYILHALNILEKFNLSEIGLPTESAKAFNILSSTMRLSIADRVEYVTDPNWKEISIAGLISKEYAANRDSLVGVSQVPDSIGFGNPSQFASTGTAQKCNNINRKIAEKDAGLSTTNNTVALDSKLLTLLSDQRSDEATDTGETTHISIIDQDGNAVSLSTTLSHVFGSGAWVNGFILNNSGFDFSDLEKDEEWTAKHSYRIRASTISPTIVLKNEEARLVIGAPGGSRIPTAILQSIVYILDYNLDPLDAVKMPRIFPNYSNPEVEIEKGFSNDILVELRKMGYDIQALSKGYARLYLVSKENGNLIGVSDPRHDGEPRGF